MIAETIIAVAGGVLGFTAALGVRELSYRVKLRKELQAEADRYDADLKAMDDAHQQCMRRAIDAIAMRRSAGGTDCYRIERELCQREQP